MLMAACAPRTVLVPPPGAIVGSAAVRPDAPTHRLLLLRGFAGSEEQFSLFWLAALHRLPQNCEAYIVTGVDWSMGAFARGGPDEAAADLEAFLADHSIPLANLHIVGHSMGGLVARRFATLHPGTIRQVFLLGTPNGGVGMLNGMNLEGWCTPAGIGEFNRLNPPQPDIDWHLLAGDHYRDRLGGAFWEGVPNDGVVAVSSVLAFRELLPDSVDCEMEVLPLTHPDWNWGENLLESRTSIDWVLDRVLADLASAPAPR